MKVLMLLSRCDQTGMTTNSLDLCEGLIDLGHEVTLIVGKSDLNDKVAASRLEDFVSLGVKIRRVQSLDKGVISRLFATLQILYQLLVNKCDIIHVESPYLTFCPWLIGKKFTSTFHVNDLVQCFYYKNATHLIAISKETKRYAMENFGFAEQDVTIVNHGVRKSFSVLADDDSKARIKKKYNIPDNRIVIGLVGSIEKRKGHQVLLNALKQLPETDLNRVHVVFCGSSKSGTANRDWLYETIESTIGWPYVTHIEYTDPKEIYDIMDIFVLPSSLEGFGLVVIEAMMSGVCAVRSDTEGASEQIIDGQTGRIFKNGDVQEFADILHDLVNDDAKRKHFAAAGREYAISHFSARRMAENTVSVYKKIINDY